MSRRRPLRAGTPRAAASAGRPGSGRCGTRTGGCRTSGPALPNAFFGSKLKTCATQSKTKASSIMALLLAPAGGGRGRTRPGRPPPRGGAGSAGCRAPWADSRSVRPGLVPDDLDTSASGDPRLRERSARCTSVEHAAPRTGTSRRSAAARPGPRRRRRATDRSAPCPRPRCPSRGSRGRRPRQRVACPRWQLGHTAHRYMGWYCRSRWPALLPWCRESPDRGQHRSHAR